MLNVINKAQKLWPKASDAEVELAAKLLRNIKDARAIRILEQARIDCKYATIPLKDIKARARAHGSNPGCSYVDCVAVNKDTGKLYECSVAAENEQAAGHLMRKYLKNVCKVEPAEYTLFIGTNPVQVHRYRRTVKGEILSTNF